MITLTKLEPIALARQTLIIPVPCPACNAPVFVPSDSDHELVTCVDMECGAELVT